MSIEQAMQNALEFLEGLGYTSGDVHDDLSLALGRLRRKYPQAAKEEL
jgi:hypothetical protein